MSTSNFDYRAPKKQNAFPIGPSADDLFTSFRLQIPIAQRQYAWQGDVGDDETDNLFEFIYDVHRVADTWHRAYVNCGTAEQARFDPSETMPTYFACGAATLLAGPKDEEGYTFDGETDRPSMVVIDGQQRLTTIAILEAALRDTLVSWHKGDKLPKAPTEYGNCDFLNTVYADADNAPFLFDLTAKNHKLKNRVPVLYREESVLEGTVDALQKICTGVWQGEKGRPEGGCSSLEEKAYWYFRNKLNLMFQEDGEESPQDQPDSKKAELLRPKYGFAMFGLALRYGVRLGVVMEPAADPEEVLEKFIKLNTQGEPLEPADIIKTALLQSCTQDPALAQRVNKRFRRFSKACEQGKNDSKAVTNIVRVWYNSFLAKTLTSNDLLIRRVREDLRNKDADFSGIGGDDPNVKRTRSEVVVESLFSTAKKYHEILKAESSPLAQAVITASGAKKSFPALVMPAAYKDNFEEALHEVARAIAIRCVLSPANASFSSSFEATQFNIQKKLRQGLSTEEIRGVLEKEMVLFGDENATLLSEDDAVEKITSLAWATNNEKKALRIVFLTIEIYLRGLLGDPCELAGSKYKPTLEHLCPQNGAEGTPWKPLNSSGTAPVDGIGNIAILVSGDNSSYGDKPLEEKLPRYKDQSYVVTKACATGKIGDEGNKTQQNNIPSDVAKLLKELKVDPKAWNPAKAEKRAKAIAKLFLRAIEYGVKTPTPRPSKEASGASSVRSGNVLPAAPKNYQLEHGKLEGLAYEEDGKIAVLQNSEASLTETEQCPALCRRIRAELVDEGVLVPSASGNSYKVVKDFPVQSLDQAAGILTGSSASASAWKSC